MPPAAARKISHCNPIRHVWCNAARNMNEAALEAGLHEHELEMFFGPPNRKLP